MTDRLFITQSMLEEWVEEGEALFEGDVLTLFQHNASFKLETAVRVAGLLDGSDDLGWIGSVLRGSELVERGAEHYRDSLIIGDTAYQCEEGFVGLDEAGEVLAPPDAALENTEGLQPSGGDEPSAVEEEKDESALLADFLLKHL